MLMLHCASSIVGPSANASEIPGAVSNARRRITDPAEGLIRRVYKHSPKRFRVIIDQLTNKPRAPAAAFELRMADPTRPDKKVDEALSVNVQSSLEAAGLGLTWGMDPERFYAVRVTVADCHNEGLTAFHDPVPDNPHHGVPGNPSTMDRSGTWQEFSQRIQMNTNASSML